MNLLNKIRRITTETYEIAWKASVTRGVPLLAVCFLLASATNLFGQSDSTAATPQRHVPPKTWIDADTGHRVTRLTDEPGSEALLSGHNAFTPDGLDMIYVSPGAIRVLNLATFKSKLLISGDVKHPIVGTKTRRVFFTRASTMDLYAIDIDTGQVTKLSSIPMTIEGLTLLNGVICSINADETLVVGTSIDSLAHNFGEFELKASREANEKMKAGNFPSSDEIKENAKRMRLEAHVPEEMFTVNLQTGEYRIILKGTDWLKSVHFSPTDPDVILYSHDAPDANTEVDRIWSIRADGTQNHVIHQRAIPGEIATHEFWSQDGKTIWHELQKPIANQPASTDHFLVGYDVATGKRRYFHMDPHDYSINYAAASNDRLFCGSGQQPTTTHRNALANGHTTESGEWIEVLHPILNNGDIGANTQNASSFRRERLVNIFTEHPGYANPRFISEVRFSPDDRLVIFTTDAFSTPNERTGRTSTYVYAVEVN
jgi:oligogalacturonide lyase